MVISGEKIIAQLSSFKTIILLHQILKKETDLRGLFEGNKYSRYLEE
jgi:hypothetical protein